MLMNMPTSKMDEVDMRIAATPMESLLTEDVPAISALCEDDIGEWING